MPVKQKMIVGQDQEVLQGELPGSIRSSSRTAICLLLSTPLRSLKDLGGEIKIVKFTRFVKGEGLEKRADDFAAEVASMVK